MEDLPQDIQDFYTTIEEQKNTPTQDNEAYSYFILYNSDGYKRLDQYIKEVILATVEASKLKSPQESLESYAAKRLASDAIVDTLETLQRHIKASADSYDQNK